MVCSDFILIKQQFVKLFSQSLGPENWPLNFAEFVRFDVRWSFQPRKHFPRITESFRRYDQWNFSNYGFLCGICSVVFCQKKWPQRSTQTSSYQKGTSQAQPFFKDMIPIIGEKKLIIDIFVGYFLKISIER